MKEFLESRKQKWSRLEELTARASRLRLRGLRGEEVREFGRLYRRTAADLAIAREEINDKRLINYLNHLVGRAHGTIYRSESTGWGGILTFYRYEFPALFRENFRPIFLAFFLSIAAAGFAYAACAINEDFADKVVPTLKEKIKAHENWTDQANEANSVMSIFIQTHNIQVTFLAFAGGLLIGAGTLIVLIENGLMLGVVINLCVKYKFWAILVFMTGHGVIELSAIFISGGAGFLIGKALLMPGDLKRIDALVTNGLTAIKLIMGCVPMLIVAGTIEGFISPAHIPEYYKFSVSAVSALALVAYFLKPDRRKEKLESLKAQPQSVQAV